MLVAVCSALAAVESAAPQYDPFTVGRWTLAPRDHNGNDQVNVGGFRIEPLGRLRYANDRLELHPKALVGGGWQDNVDGVPEDGLDSAFYRGVAGIETRFHVTRGDLAVADLEIERRAYVEDTERDLTGGRAVVGWVRQGPQLGWGTGLAWNRSDDPLVETGEQILHDDYAARFSGRLRTNFSRFEAGAGFQRTDYLEAARRFGEDERDHQIADVSFGYGREHARERFFSGHLRGRFADYDQDTRYADSTGAAALVGWDGLLVTVTWLRAQAGVEWRRFEPPRSSPATEDEALVAVWDLGLLWRPEPDSALLLRTFSRLDESVTALAVQRYGVSALGRLRLRYTMAASAAVEYYRQDYDPDLAPGVEDDDVLAFQAWLDWRMREGVAGRVIGEYTEVDSGDGRGYTTWRVGLELATAL